MNFRSFALITFCVLFFSFCSLGFTQVQPYDLTVEYMHNPVGIDSPKPRLSWKSKTLDPNLQNVYQTAYRILVASGKELLDRNQGDLWDSGKVESQNSLNIEYAGKPLTTSQRCYWKVQTWYKANDKAIEKESQSEPAFWVMGVMRAEDWKAKWIASNEKFRKDYDLGNAKWIWTGDAENLGQAQAGKRYFRTTFHVGQVKTNLNNEDIALKQGILAITADDEYKVYINGKAANETWGHVHQWNWLRFVDISHLLHEGENLLAVEVRNKERGPTGVLADLELRGQGKSGETVTSKTAATSNAWTSSAEPTEGWNSKMDFQSEKWKPAVEIGPVDCAPWHKIQRRWETKSPAFGKTFTVDSTKQVKNATLHITGLGFYEASLNGKKIGNKVLDPVQTRYDKRVMYSTYDMNGLLQSGQNRIEVLLGHGWYDVRAIAVWNFDTAPWRDFCRMIAQMEILYEDGSKEFVLSDDSWDQIESPIIFDCIRQSEIITTSAREVIAKASQVDAPKGSLVAESLPASIIAQELKPIKISEPRPDVYVLDFGQNIAGWLRLNIDGQKAADIIQIQYTERLKSDGNVDMRPINEHFRYRFPFWNGVDEQRFPTDMFQIDTFVCKTGKGEKYEPRFIYHGFRYVELTGLAKAPKSEDVTACVVHTDFQKAGKFECSNELFNKIQNATLWSYKGNFVNGVPTDCPHREKNGWTGDAHLAAEQAMYNWDNTAGYEKWIRDLLDEQRPDGNLPGIVPTSGWGYTWGNGPAWDSALVLIPWYLYEYKADKRILEESYGAMKKYVDYLSSHEKPNGLVDHGLGDWCFAKTQTPVVVTSSVYYYIDAKIVAKTAKILGKDDDAQNYSALAEKIKADYLKELLKTDGTIANGSQTAQSFAFANGMLEELTAEQKKQIAAKLFESVEKAKDHLDFGILGAKTLFECLSENGRTDLALKILNQTTAPSYGDWLARGATTLWEDWGDGSSRNHVMYGDVSRWFYQEIGGIQAPQEPAFKKIRLRLEFPDGIDWAKTEHDSPYGPICVQWKRDREKSKILVDVKIPVNTTATAQFKGDSIKERTFGSGVYHIEL